MSGGICGKHAHKQGSGCLKAVAVYSFSAGRERREVNIMSEVNCIWRSKDGPVSHWFIVYKIVAIYLKGAQLRRMSTRQRDPTV